MNDDVRWIELSRLRAHPLNSNVMRAELLDKLAGHIADTGRYPPLIVREIEGGVYQVLDGHHRWKAIERANHERAACVVWDVDDAGAMLLLSTLNRLQGHDDPRKRAGLLAELYEKMGRDAAAMAKRLPETAQQVRAYLKVREPAPEPAMARPLEQMPTAVTFFLTGQQRHALDERLGAIGGTREAALMRLVEGEA